MNVQKRTLWPSFGKIFERRHGRNVESKELGEFIAENRKDDQRCMGIYEVRLRLRKGQNPDKDFDFFVNSAWVEITSRIRNRSLKKTIKHPDHLELRIPETISDAVFFNERRKTYAVRLAITELKAISKKRKLDQAGISDATRDGAPAKKQTAESPVEYEKEVSAQFEKVPTTQVVPTLHLKENDAEGEGQTAKPVKSDDENSTDKKMETCDTESAKQVDEAVKKTTTENKVTSKNKEKAQKKKSQQNKQKKQNKNRERQRLQSIKDKKRHEEKKAKELEDKHSKEFALVDSLVSTMEKTSKFKQKQVKRKLDAIETMMNHKYEKKRGRTKKTEEIKKLCIEEVREDMRQKKLEAREKYKRNKDESGIKFV